MGFFDLALNEIATWVYVLISLLFVIALTFSYFIGFLRAERVTKKKYQYQTPFVFDLPRDVGFRVLAVHKSTQNCDPALFFLKRLTESQDIIICQAKTVSEVESFSARDIVKVSGEGVLKKID